MIGEITIGLETGKGSAATAGCGCRKNIGNSNAATRRYGNIADDSILASVAVAE